MGNVSLCNGVIFIEGSHPNAIATEEIEYVRDAFCIGRQMNVASVKEQLSKRARDLGCNAVVNFRCGQKPYGSNISESLFLDGNMIWYGDGVAAIIDERTYNEYLKTAGKGR